MVCFPKITLPTRFSNSHGTLIDNFLYKLSEVFFKSSAGILVSSISDHFPYFICLDYKQHINNVPKFIKFIKYDTGCLNQNKTELINSNIYNKLKRISILILTIITTCLMKLLLLLWIIFYKLKLLNTINTTTKSHVGLHNALSGQ